MTQKVANYARKSRKYPQVIESRLEHLQTPDWAETTCAAAEMDPFEGVPTSSWSIEPQFCEKYSILWISKYWLVQKRRFPEISWDERILTHLYYCNSIDVNVGVVAHI